jgi:3-phenylpropionate/trans-cinnamate dioxygenase ferredoxin subunit
MRTLRFPRSAAPDPGRVRTVEAGGRRIGLVWVDDRLYGLADACPHRGAPICSAGALVHRVESDGRSVVRREPADQLRCPWHKWDFDVRTGVCAEAPHMRVRRYRVWLEDDEIVVSLAPVRD